MPQLHVSFDLNDEKNGLEKCSCNMMELPFGLYKLRRTTHDEAPERHGYKKLFWKFYIKREK